MKSGQESVITVGIKATFFMLVLLHDCKLGISVIEISQMTFGFLFCCLCLFQTSVGKIRLIKAGESASKISLDDFSELFLILVLMTVLDFLFYFLLLLNLNLGARREEPSSSSLAVIGCF